MLDQVNLNTWLTFVNQLAQVYAMSRGKDIRALGYLQTATQLIGSQSFTNDEMTRLMGKYQQRVALDEESTLAELTQVRDEIRARSLLIQQ